MTRSISEPEIRRRAIAIAFESLGPNIKQVITHHLEAAHGFVVGRDHSLVELNNALSKTFGAAAAQLLLELVYVEIDKITEMCSEC